MVSPWEGLFISLIQLTFPAFRVLFCIILLPYLVCYLLFLTGVYLAIRSYIAGGRAGLALRLLALGCLFLSYSTNSFLVLHAGFLGLMILFVGRVRQVSILAAAWRYLSRHVDFLVLPLVYWGIKEFLYPRHGVYADYNAVRLSAGELAGGLPRFLTNAVVLQLNDALLALMGMPVLLLVLVVALLFVFSRRDLRAAAFFGDPASAVRMACFGAGLLALAVMPYVLVGKIASATLWNTRFSLLVGLGIAVIIVAMARGLGSRRQGSMSLGSLAVLVMLVLAFAVTMVSNYVAWQARWVKDRSVMLHLREMPPCPANTYWIDDRFPIAAQDPYSAYEWSSIFKEVWGGESRTGLPEVKDRPAYLEQHVKRYRAVFDRQHNLTDYNPKGPQAVITICPGPRAVSESYLAVYYWYYRYVARGLFDEFLHEAADVRLERIGDTP
jgi:hypothetical protein